MRVDDYLNQTVWAKLAPSKIHGVGVFAIRDIPKGQKIFARCDPNTQAIKLDSFDRLLPEIAELIDQRWFLARKGETFQSPNNDARLISFMNHSDTPNYDKYNDVVLVDIKKGIEITENYVV